MVLKDNGERITDNEIPIEESKIICKDKKFKTDMIIEDFIFKLGKKNHHVTPSAITNRWRDKQKNEHLRYLKRKLGRELTKDELKLVKRGKL